MYKSSIDDDQGCQAQVDTLVRLSDNGDDSEKTNRYLVIIIHIVEKLIITTNCTQLDDFELNNCDARKR